MHGRGSRRPRGPPGCVRERGIPATISLLASSSDISNTTTSAMSISSMTILNTSIANTNTSSTSTSSASTSSTCGLGATLLPVPNNDIDLSSSANLQPSFDATLNYAETSPGKQAASLFLTMAYPQVTLENSKLLSVACSDSGDQVVVTADSDITLQYIMDTWPPSGLVLFTNFPGCNPDSSRGIYSTRFLV